MLEKGKKVELEQYQCNNCGRMFYLDINDKSDLDMEVYICPYNCNHYMIYSREQRSEHTRTAIVKVERLHLV